ncbi:MAG: oligosaccharide flippase family protein [bacterium]
MAEQEEMGLRKTSDVTAIMKDEGPSVRFAPGAVAGIPWMVATKAVLFFVYFGISIVAVRKLGKEQYGVLSLCRNVSEYLVVLCALGLNSAILRFVPELALTRNMAGIKRLLWKSACLQGIAVVGAIGVLWLMTPLFSQWFRVPFGSLLVIAGLLSAAQLSKDYLNDTFTSLFRSRLVSSMSFIQALLWLGLLWAGLTWRPTVGVGLGAQIVSMGLVSMVGFVLLLRFVRQMKWRSPPLGIGRVRTLKLSSATLFNSMFRMLMLKYTEVFFLGVYFTPSVVGVYDLGYTMPFVAMTLIPSALQTLFTSAFAEAYSRDRDCLGRLITAVYKMLILLVIPMAAFGFFFAPRAVVLLYGETMRASGWIASFFCVLHALPLISMPLSMAITAREKVLNMLPYMIMQVAVNLVLDYLLIPKWGIPGAVSAVALTFIVTIPIRLWAVRQILGAIHFPAAFCFRIVLSVVALAGGLSFLSPYLNLAGLFGVTVLFLASYLVIIKKLGLINVADNDDLQLLAIGRLGKIVRLLSRGSGTLRKSGEKSS